MCKPEALIYSTFLEQSNSNSKAGDILHILLWLTNLIYFLCNQSPIGLFHYVPLTSITIENTSMSHTVALGHLFLDYNIGNMFILSRPGAVNTHQMINELHSYNTLYLYRQSIVHSFSFTHWCQARHWPILTLGLMSWPRTLEHLKGVVGESTCSTSWAPAAAKCT